MSNNETSTKTSTAEWAFCIACGAMFTLWVVDSVNTKKIRLLEERIVALEQKLEMRK